MHKTAIPTPVLAQLRIDIKSRSIE